MRGGPPGRHKEHAVLVGVHLRGRKFNPYGRETREEGKERHARGRRTAGSRRASREEKHSAQTENSPIGEKEQVQAAAASEEGASEGREQVTARDAGGKGPG